MRLRQEVQEVLRHHEDYSVIRSHLIWVCTDDCRPVANNLGSFANNMDTSIKVDTSIDAINSSKKSPCLQSELRINTIRYNYEERDDIQRL